jgi:hypothetical protein
MAGERHWQRFAHAYHGPVTSDAARIAAIAGAAREFLLPRWRRWHCQWGPPEPATLSQWTCLRSSAFLCLVLGEAGIAARVESGVPDPAAPADDGCGYWSEGPWVSHGWVAGTGFIADITSDQFGGPPVVVTAELDVRYRAGRSPATTLSITERGALAIEELAHEWRLAPERRMLRRQL